MRSPLSFLALLGLLNGVATCLLAQDTRKVTEPMLPPVCTVIHAPLRSTPDGPNVKPGRQEQNAESDAESRTLSMALTNCPQGQAVELALGTDVSDDAFLIDPIVFPKNVSLIIDGGVTVFASRDPSLYQDNDPKSNPNGIQCGTVGDYPPVTGCIGLFQVTDNNGIYGYGIVDGQGDKPLLSGKFTGKTWWDLTFSKVGTTNEQSSPWLISSGKKYGLHADNFILYKVTLRSPPFHTVKWSGNGLTVWGVKIQAPWNVGNTDGFDLAGENMTLFDTTVSNGDDDIAFGTNAAPTKNITIDSFHIYGRDGITILGNGSGTKWPITNLLVQNVTMTGDLPSVQNTTVNGVAESILIDPNGKYKLKSYAQALPNATNNIDGFNIKPSSTDGPIIEDVTFKNTCMQDIGKPINIVPQTAFSGVYPLVQNIRYENIHVLKPTPQFVKLANGVPAGAGSYQLFLEADQTKFSNQITFDNVVFDDVSPNESSLTLVKATGNIITTETNVYPAALNSLTAGDYIKKMDLNTELLLTSNSYPSWTTTSIETLAQACHRLPFISGELYVTERGTNFPGNPASLPLATAVDGSSITLNAVVQPIMSQVSYFGPKIYGAEPGLLAVGSPALTNPIRFYDGWDFIGSASLAANGTLARLTINNIRAGTHTYRAEYPADAYYGSLPFGLVVVNVERRPFQQPIRYVPMKDQSGNR